MTAEERTSILSTLTDVRFVLAFTLLVVLITYFLTRRRKRSENAVVLVGLSDAGKSTIITKLVFNEVNKKTVTSVQVTRAEIVDLNLVVYDLPGSQRLLKPSWELNIPKARHVVYVLDSVSVERSIRSQSELLYSLLNDPVVNKNDIRFIIACHKQDLEEAKKKDFIKDLLEKELEAVRKSKCGELGRTSGEQDEDYITKKFSKGCISLDALRVEMIETSVYNLDQLIKKML